MRKLPLLTVLIFQITACSLLETPQPGEPDCIRNSDCQLGQLCVSGACVVECAEDRDCSDGRTCQQGQCSLPGTDAGPGSDAGPPVVGPPETLPATACEEPTTVTGLISGSIADLDYSAEPAIVSLHHSQAADEADDGCIARIQVELKMLDGRGCRLDLGFESVQGGRLVLARATLNADAFCPGWDSGHRGLYSLSAGTAAAFVDHRVPGRLVDRACVGPLSLQFFGSIELEAEGQAETLDLDLTALRITGNFNSVADPELLCPAAAECGDGVLDVGESCDDGNDDETDDCRRCLAPACGDGVRDRQLNEACDDGNQVPGDGCDEACQNEDVQRAGAGGEGQPVLAEPSDEERGVERNGDGFIVPANISLSFDHVWVVSTQAGTVSKIHIETLNETGRYTTVGPNDDELDVQGASPKCTGIDLNGDLFVANRAYGRQGSVSKIAGSEAHCIDRNDNQQIETSRDVNGNGRIDVGDPREFLGLADECLLWTQAVGVHRTIIEAVAVDSGDPESPAGNVWALGREVNQAYGLRGVDGELIMRDELGNPVALGQRPSAAVADSLGYVWVVTGGGTLKGFSVRTGRLGETGIQTGPLESGVTIDSRDRVSFFDSRGQRLVRFDPYHDDEGNRVEDPLSGQGTLQSSPARAELLLSGGAAADDTIWFADYRANEMKSFHRETLELGRVYPVGNARAVGVDGLGMVWAVGNENVYRIDPANPERPPALADGLGGHHYQSGDFTGFNPRLARHSPPAIYGANLSGCEEGPTRWLLLSLNAELPAETAIHATVRVANTAEILAGGGGESLGPLIWSAGADNPSQVLEALPTGAFMALSFELLTEAEVSPVLQSYQVEFVCP